MKWLAIILAIFAGLTAYTAISANAADRHHGRSYGGHSGHGHGVQSGHGYGYGARSYNYGHGNYGHTYRPAYPQYGYGAPRYPVHGHHDIHVVIPHIDFHIGH